MCLHITISEFAGGARLPSAAAVAKASNLTVHKEHGSRTGALQLFAWEKDCGCGLLAPESRIDTNQWTLSAEFLPRIAAALAFVSKSVPRFAFSALFFGESPHTEMPIALSDLQRLVIANRIRNHFKYIVVRKRARTNNRLTPLTS